MELPSEVSVSYPPREKLLIFALASVQFVHILDFVILMPLGPMLMRAFSLTPTQFGFLVSSYTLAAGVCSFLTSIVAERFERKTMLLTSFAGFLLGTLFCAFAPNYPLLLAARILAGAFGGVLAGVVFALIPHLVPPERRGRATGTVMSAFSLASVLGVPVGLMLAEWSHWHAPFLLIVGLGIVFWLMCYHYIPKLNNQQKAGSAQETLSSFFHIVCEPLHIKGFCLTSLLGFGIFMIIPYLSPFMVKNVGLAETDLKYIYLCGGAATIFFSRWVGRLCDQYGCFRVFTYVTLLSSIPALVITHLAQTPLPVALCFTTLFMMTGSGRFIPAITLLSLVVDARKRGTFMGLEGAFRQLSSGIGSLVAGLIIFESESGQLQNYSIIGISSVLFAFCAWLAARHISRVKGLS